MRATHVDILILMVVSKQGFPQREISGQLDDAPMQSLFGRLPSYLGRLFN